MSISQGNIILVNNPASSTPATVTGANNGLSIDNKIVQLGGSLIKDTTINLAAFSFFLKDALNQFVLWFDGNTDNIVIGDAAKQAIVLTRDTKIINFTIDFKNRLLVSGTNDYYSFGDLDQSENGCRLVIDDRNQKITFERQNVVPKKFLDLDILNALYIFGDADGFNNAFQLRLDDSNGHGKLFDNNGDYINIDFGTNLYQFGDITNGTKININATVLTVTDVNDISYFIIDPVNFVYQLGDSNNQILIDKTNEQIIIKSNGKTYFNAWDALGKFELGNPASGCLIDIFNAGTMNLNAPLGFTFTGQINCENIFPKDQVSFNMGDFNHLFVQAWAKEIHSNASLLLQAEGGDIDFVVKDSSFALTQFIKLFFSSGNLQLQSGGVFTDIASSKFSVNSTTQGTLPAPKMAKAERDAIVSPTGGLQVMVTDQPGGEYLSWYNSATPGWVKVSSVAD